MKNRIINVIIVLVFLSAAMFMGYTFYTQKYEAEDIRCLNGHLTLVQFNDGKLGIRDNVTGAVSGRFDDVLPYCQEQDAVFVVVNDDLRGYVSGTTGEVLFKPQFRYAWVNDTSSCLAACVNEDNRLGFVNVKTGEVAIPFQFDFDESEFMPYSYIYGERSPKLDFVFSNGLCLFPGENGKVGLLDETGVCVLPAEYSDIINWKDADTPEIILRRRLLDCLDGVYDESGDMGNRQYGVVDRKFNIILPFEYDSIEKVWTDDGGIKILGYIVSRDGVYGLLDAAFGELLPLEYDAIESSMDKKAFIASRNGKYGVLDDSFRTILPFEYDYVREEYLGDGNSGYVVVKDYVQMLFDSRGVLINDFYMRSRTVFDYEMDEYVEETGLSAIPEPCRQVASPYIKYHLDGYYGVIDGTKRVVVPAKYDKIEYLGYGSFACTVDDNVYLLHDKK